jgi:hypothetical protein
VRPAAGELVDQLRLDLVDDHPALARQGPQPSPAAIAGAHGPDAMDRPCAGLQGGFDRDVALEHHRPLVERHRAPIRPIRHEIAIGQEAALGVDAGQPDRRTARLELAGVEQRQGELGLAVGGEEAHLTVRLRLTRHGCDPVGERGEVAWVGVAGRHGLLQRGQPGAPRVVGAVGVLRQ